MTPFVKKFAMPVLGATLAASLALSPITATPARAGNEAAAVAATGFLALLMAGLVASGAQGRVGVGGRDRDPGFGPGGAPDHRRPHPPELRDIYVPGPGSSRHPHVDPKKMLPDQCRVTYRLGGTRAPYFEKSCLMRHMHAWPMLPERCEQTVRISGSGVAPLVAYPESCLARFGYQVASDCPGRRH